MVILLASHASYADAPTVVLSVENDPDVGSLVVAAGIEWNRDDLLGDAAKRTALRKRGIYYGAAEGEKVVTHHRLRDRNLTLEMVFPKKEQGRALNESTRVELSLYEGKTLLFRSRWFGQHADEYTEIPGSEIKFRPNLIRVSPLSYSADAKDSLQLSIWGERGEGVWTTEGEVSGCIERGFATEFRLDEGAETVINDQFLSELFRKHAERLISPTANRLAGTDR